MIGYQIQKEIILFNHAFLITIYKIKRIIIMEEIFELQRQLAAL